MNTNTAGKFMRSESSFRNWVTVDGRPGPSGEGGFQAESGRYHLYVSYACPWAHRTLIFRTLKGLDRVISVSAVHPLIPDASWVFGDYPGATPDHVHGFQKLHQLHDRRAPDFDGLVTEPVLYDKQHKVIVNNESSEIIRMLNGAFDEWGRADIDFYAEHLRAEIDAVNAIVYENINNEVYRAGFASAQAAYETAFWWTIRICGRTRGSSTRWSGVSETVYMDHIKLHYYRSHRGINPTGIVPKGPQVDFSAPHGRGEAGARLPA